MTLSPAMTALHARARRHVPGARLPSPLSEADLRHLVRRLTWGDAPGLLDEVRRDPQAWLDAQLEPGSVEDGACAGYVGRFERLGWSVQRVREVGPVGDATTMWHLGFATLARYAWSRRQLFEVMCDLWSNHLNITSPSSDVWDTRHDFDARVVRAHALGSFSDMLLASARHPAMLRYLDGASSTRAAPNENYARELMELHTVGVGAGYGEEGVRAVARVMTGATVDWRTSTYAFDAARHDPGAASVLGWSTGPHAAAQGEAVQADLLRHLALHRSTAESIARRLCLRFVSDDPPAALVAELADVYQAHGSQLVPVLRALFASPAFWAAQGAKTRRPLEGFVAVLRVIGSTPGPDGQGGMDSLYWMVRDLGHAPLAWAPPNGYPDVAAAWQSAGSTMARWNATTSLVQGWWPTTLARRPTSDLLPSPLPATYGGLVDALVRRLLGRPATDRERTALCGFCDRTPGSALSPGDDWVGRRLPYLVHTVLNAPGHMER